MTLENDSTKNMTSWISRAVFGTYLPTLTAQGAQLLKEERLPILLDFSSSYSKTLASLSEDNFNDYLFVRAGAKSSNLKTLLLDSESEYSDKDSVTQILVTTEGLVYANEDGVSGVSEFLTNVAKWWVQPVNTERYNALRETDFASKFLFGMYDSLNRDELVQFATNGGDKHKMILVYNSHTTGGYYRYSRRWGGLFKRFNPNNSD